MDEVKELLFVDDVEAICQVFKVLVQTRCKIHVTTCNSGKAAIELLKTKKFDILVTDIIMPGMNGIELTEYVLQHYDIPIVLTTGYEKDLLPSGFDETEAVCCISKPYTVTEIGRNIRKAVQKKRAIDKAKRSAISAHIKQTLLMYC